MALLLEARAGSPREGPRASVEARHVKEVREVSCRPWDSRLTRSQIETWLRDCAGRLSPETCNRKLRTLRAFLRWCVSKGWIVADPSAGIKRLREIKRDDKELTLDDEIARNLKAADQLGDPLVNDLFRLALNTGARPGEIVNLRVEDADIDGRVLFIRNRDSRKVKDRGTTPCGERDDGEVQA